MSRGVTLLGATGSVGTQTLDVLRCHAGTFHLHAVAAGAKASGLAAIVREFRPALAGLAEPAAVDDELRSACLAAGTRLVLGPEASREVAAT